MVCDQIVDCPHSTARFQEEGFPCIDTTWMTVEGLAQGRARYVDKSTYEDRISRLQPRAGDIVFAREGTIGTAIMIPVNMTPCLGQRVMLLRPSCGYSNGLLLYTLHSEVVKRQYRAQSLGSTVAHINVGDVKRFAIPVPPSNEQQRIVAEIDRRLSLIRGVEVEVETNLKRAQALRQCVLSKAFKTP
jgi:type I restriction enzyme, S subunit